MTVAPGSHLGPYEILSALGAGGMGEVYRARDARLSRDVAIKVLPEEISSDPSRLRRFEKEARAASALNHPNIVTVHEIGRKGSIDFLVMELVAGKTLRDLLLSAAMPVRKLLPIAAQIADGLAAAHEAGIVHRDLKPENVMVTSSGLVKILDFGLAKRTSAGSGSDQGSHLPTETGTSPGMILGTVGYMSPEQAAGQPLDFRSDQFAFGSILYELATGKRAFQKATAVDTLSAILHEEPRPLTEVSPEAPAPLRWIVERCLSKEPERRYAATRDLARDLETLRDHSSEPNSPLPAAAGSRRRRWVPAAIFSGGLLLAALVGLSSLRKAPAAAPLKFQRLTFGRGLVDVARFSPDGQTIVYSASWDGHPFQIFSTRPESRTSQKLAIPDASLESLSAAGDLAIKTGRPTIIWWAVPGTLSVVPVGGGTPRELATDVSKADWAPDGKRMAVSRGNNLEFPMGKVIYRSAGGGTAFPRVSPAGDRIAFWENHRIQVVDSTGKKIFTSRRFNAEVVTVTWNATGEEIWVTEAFSNEGVVHALSLSGKERIPFRIPTGLALLDISRDGRMLVAVGNHRWESWLRPNGRTADVELTVTAKSDAMGLSPDGKNLLINDTGAFYLRDSDGSPPKKLGDGMAAELSSDGKWAAIVRPGPPAQLVLVPTGPGDERALENGVLEEIYWDDLRWSGDGRRLLFGGNEKGKSFRLYVQDIAGGKPRPLTPENVETRSSSISPDGRLVLVEQNDGFWLYTVDSGDKRLFPGLRAREFVWRNWSEDGRFIYAWNALELPFLVSRIEVATGRREPWKTITPQDPAGVWAADLMLTPDGKSFAYNCKRALRDLYLVEGLK